MKVRKDGCPATARHPDKDCYREIPDQREAADTWSCDNDLGTVIPRGPDHPDEKPNREPDLLHAETIDACYAT